MSATIEIRVRVPGCRIDINIDRPTLPEALTDAIRLLTASTQGVPEAASAPATQDGADL